MKKIFFSLTILASTFFGAEVSTGTNYNEEVYKKEIMKKYADAIHESANEKIKEKEKREDCKKYLDRADDLFGALNSKDILNQYSKMEAYSIYTSSLMKRYEICLNENPQSK